MVASDTVGERRLGWIYAVLGAAAIVEYFELNMMYVLLPRLYETFGSPAQVGWAVTAFSLVGAAAVAVGGRIGDVIGHRRMLIVALAASAVGSFVSATATDLWQLIAGRAIQGTAAIILPMAISLLRALVSSTDRQKFGTGVIAGVGYSAAGVAPLTAGLLVGTWDWHAVFLVSGGLAVIVMVLAFLLPDDRRSGGSWGQIDLVGAVTLIPGIVLLLLGITRIASAGLGRPLTIGLLVAGALVLAGWGAYERRQPNPVIDLKLFRNPGFAVSCLSFALYSLTLGAAILLSLVGQNPVSAGGFGMTPALFGGFMLLLVVAGTIMNVVGGWMSVRIGCRATLVVGAIVQMIGYGVVGVFLISTDARALWMFPIVLLSGLGNGIVNAVLPAFVSESVPVEKSGMALGIQQVIKMATQAVGQQVVAALLIVFPLVAAVAGGPATIPSQASIVLIYFATVVVSLLIVPVALLAPVRRQASAEVAA